MSCTTPEVPPSHASEAAEFAKEFAEQTSIFNKALDLPSPLDSSVLGFKSKSAPYYVKELENPDIVRPFIQKSLEDIIQGITITVDTTAIVNALINILNSFVRGAKVTSTFGGYSTASYRGTVFETDAIVKIVLAVYIVDSSKLYNAAPGTIFELAYSAFLTAQRAE